MVSTYGPKRYHADLVRVICGDDAFTLRVMQAAPKLRVISKWGTGIDSIDQVSAGHLGILVRNTPDAFTQPVADTVLGYMLSFARDLPWMSRDVHAGQWVKTQGMSLGETTLGVIGIGNVGRAVIRRAASFGMRMLGNDIADISENFVSETGLEVVSKADLLSTADFVSLNCDLNSSSHHLIGNEELALMKPSAYLINTARGPLVDEPALVKALQDKEIAGAALDVFEIEPLPADSPLLSMDNCLLAPHNANSSPVAYKRVHENTIRNLLDGLRENRRMSTE